MVDNCQPSGEMGLPEVDLRQGVTPGTRFALWLLQPKRRRRHLEKAPFHHPATDEDTWPLLEAVLKASRDSKDPTVYVVPELTLDPNLIPKVRSAVEDLPPRHVLVAGIGHLTAQQCEQVEAGSARRFNSPWPESRFANCALIGAPGEDNCWVEGKRWPSQWEQREGCHQACNTMRVYRLGSYRFAVVICADMAAPDSSWVKRLSREKPDIIFWLQDNPKPRHQDFLKPLVELLGPSGSRPLVVCCNKAPETGRSPHGASGFITGADFFPRQKSQFPTTPHISTESVCSKAALTRATLVRYDASAHLVRSVMPSEVPAERNDARRSLLQEVTPYLLTAGELRPSLEPRHAQHLFDAGRNAAKTRARRAGLNEGRSSLLDAELPRVESQVCADASLLLCLLDAALVQAGAAWTHANHESHSPAAACDCWEHRRNFDTLYRVEGGREDPTAEYLGELLLALSSLQLSGIDVKYKSFGDGKGPGLAIASRGERLVVAVHEGTPDAFKRRYFGADKPYFISRVSAIVLEVNRPTSSTDATDVLLDDGLAADRAGTDLRALYGGEFWKCSDDQLVEWVNG